MPTLGGKRDDEDGGDILLQSINDDDAEYGGSLEEVRVALVVAGACCAWTSFLACWKIVCTPSGALFFVLLLASTAPTGLPQRRMFLFSIVRTVTVPPPRGCVVCGCPACWRAIGPRCGVPRVPTVTGGAEEGHPESRRGSALSLERPACFAANS